MVRPFCLRKLPDKSMMVSGGEVGPYRMVIVTSLMPIMFSSICVRVYGRLGDVVCADGNILYFLHSYKDVLAYNDKLRDSLSQDS